VTGDAALTGKDLGRDEAAGKATVVSLLGTDGARARLDQLRDSAAGHLRGIGNEAHLLHEVFDFVISRLN
jgi:farnesyl diphosphate synthase